MKILHIDKDENLGAFLGEILRKSGYCAIGVPDIESGLEELVTTAVDAVVLGTETSVQDLRGMVREIRARQPKAAVLLYGTVWGSLDPVPDIVDGMADKHDIPALLTLLKVLAAERREVN